LTTRSPSDETPAVADAPRVVSIASAKKSTRRAPSSLPAWLKGAIDDDRGRVLPNLANVMIALRRAPELVETFTYDEMLRAPVLNHPLPVVEGMEAVETEPLPRPLQDSDVSRLQEWLQHAGLPKIGRETTHQAVDQRARERAFHPVRDYLDGLTWDDTPRLDCVSACKIDPLRGVIGVQN